MKKTLTFPVQTADTLLPFLLLNLSGKSRNYVKGALTRGQVAVDGTPAKNHAQALRPGQTVTIQMGQDMREASLPFPILFEDESLLVIDKPAGLLSMGTDQDKENTAYYLLGQYLRRKDKSAQVFIVHRLDRDTSGLLLFAKNKETKDALQENWETLVKRRGYLALVEGTVESTEGQLRSWLRETKTFLVYSSPHEGDGKLAVTSYRLLKAGARYSLLELSLETGRKNQIRVHMKDLGHPVAGDKKYGATTNPLKRLALHASALEIQHPHTGELMQFKSPAPPEFSKAFSKKPRK